MLTLKELNEKLTNATKYTESKNFFYEAHECAENLENTKVKLDYKLKDEVSGEIIKFGFCDDCGECYFHNDHETGSR